MNINRKDLKDILKYTAVLLLGNLLFAFSVYAFIEPYRIAVGGFSGLGLFLEYTFHIPAEWFILPANIAVLILGWLVLGKKMVLSSIASSLLYPLFFAVLRYVPGINALTGNTLLAAGIGGAGVGAAIGILMRVGASTGGSDIICLALHKWFHLPVSVFVLVLDFLIIFGQAFFSDVEMALYGLAFTAVEIIVLNKVMLLGQSQIQIMVISDEYDKIRMSILNELHFGVTMMRIQTGCRGKEQMGAICVVHPRQLYALQKKILAIDPGAFITVTNIKEVRGQGFTSERIDLAPVPGNEDQREA